MQKFDTPTPISAVMDIPAGRIRFIATDRTDTTVEIQPADPSRNRDTKAAEQTTITCTDRTLQITAPQPGNKLPRPTGSLAVTIRLPTGSHIEARTAGAELHCEGHLGHIAFDGAHRRIRIDQATSLHLTATDGDIEVGQLDGPAQISTERGDIRITEALRGTLVLNTQLGDITVTAAPGTPAHLDAGTAHGRITNTLKNDGTPTLDIHATTSHGDITARSL
ncbi:DUF4097 domain-containing protein [Streptomyces sp. STR69]|uniref:DUF4097 domain-containing protein n=1 Tax=Streptomyces sp. STR69 TaxID=1796942 RepID=UPI0021C74F28|nr:DUF4097 domain-containing protein [Streptomyces sp. STR69]